MKRPEIKFGMISLNCPACDTMHQNGLNALKFGQHTGLKAFVSKNKEIVLEQTCKHCGTVGCRVVVPSDPDVSTYPADVTVIDSPCSKQTKTARLAPKGENVVVPAVKGKRKVIQDPTTKTIKVNK